MNNQFFSFAIVGLCYSLLGGDCLAKPEPAPKLAPLAEQEESNVKIIADSLECDQIKNVCIALGNAFIEKLNDPDKKTIQADRIEMFFEKTDEKSVSKEQKKESAAGQKAKEFHADGNVIVTLKETIIRGNRAIYNPDTDIAEVFENVSVTSGKNEVLGNYGRADLKTGEYKVLNSGGRVTALVFQGSKK